MIHFATLNSFLQEVHSSQAYPFECWHGFREHRDFSIYIFAHFSKWPPKHKQQAHTTWDNRSLLSSLWYLIMLASAKFNLNWSFTIRIKKDVELTRAQNIVLCDVYFSVRSNFSLGIFCFPTGVYQISYLETSIVVILFSRISSREMRIDENLVKWRVLKKFSQWHINQ